MPLLSPGEIAREPIALTEGEPYTPQAGDVVFTEAHTIADIVRYAVSCGGAQEVRTLLDMMEEEA